MLHLLTFFPLYKRFFICVTFHAHLSLRFLFSYSSFSSISSYSIYLFLPFFSFLLSFPQLSSQTFPLSLPLKLILGENVVLGYVCKVRMATVPSSVSLFRGPCKVRLKYFQKHCRGDVQVTTVNLPLFSHHPEKVCGVHISENKVKIVTC